MDGSLIDLYLHAKFNWNRRNILWTDKHMYIRIHVCKDGRTDWHTFENGFITLTLSKSRLNEHTKKKSKPNMEKCKNCSNVSAYHCAQLSYTTQYRTVLIIFPLILQTSTRAQMLSIGGEGERRVIVNDNKSHIFGNTAPNSHIRGDGSSETKCCRVNKRVAQYKWTNSGWSHSVLGEFLCQIAAQRWSKQVNLPYNH